MTPQEARHVLGLRTNATKAEVKKARAQQMLIHHPDVGGDPEKAANINKAYEVLYDMSPADKVAETLSNVKMHWRDITGPATSGYVMTFSSTYPWAHARHYRQQPTRKRNRIEGKTEKTCAVDGCNNPATQQLPGLNIYVCADFPNCKGA